MWAHRQAGVRILVARTVTDKEGQRRKVPLARNSLHSHEIQVRVK